MTFRHKYDLEIMKIFRHVKKFFKREYLLSFL